MLNARLLIAALTCSAAVGDVGVPAIDGFLNDPFWSRRARVWRLSHPRMPDNNAVFYLGFDETHLYLAADVTDANIFGHHHQRKDETWKDDAVTFLLDFGDGTARDRTPSTFSYEFSAAGGASWTRGVADGSGENYPGHDWLPNWMSGLEWATRLKPGSTINVELDRDRGYVVETRIPWTELGTLPPFAPDRRIGVCLLNICRPEQDESNQGLPITSMPGIDGSNQHAPYLWQRVRMDWQGPLQVRGLAEPLPQQLDQDRWSARIAWMHSLGLNTLLLDHQPVDNKSKHSDWILNAARERDIDVFQRTRYAGETLHKSAQLETDPSLPGIEPATTKPSDTGRTPWLLYPMQGKQWFSPMIDSHLAGYARSMMSAATDPPVTSRSVTVLGGPRSAHAYLFWGDPSWMHRLVTELRRVGIDGMIFAHDTPDAWLAVEPFAHYSSRPQGLYESAIWTQRLNDVYGVGEQAEDLLDAVQHASAIMPRFITLLHSQSDRYMPQFGLLLAYYLNMPTLTDPPTGTDWNTHFADIRSTVMATTPRDAIDAEKVANEIRNHVSAIRGYLETLRTVTPEDASKADALKRLLDRLALNAAIGDHFERKIRAALAWVRFKHRGGRSRSCLQELEVSVGSWENVVTLADRLYPEPVPYWQLRMNKPGPWTQADIQDNTRRVIGHWRDQLPVFKRELELLRQRISTQYRRAELPLLDELTAP